MPYGVMIFVNIALKGNGLKPVSPNPLHDPVVIIRFSR